MEVRTCPVGATTPLAAAHDQSSGPDYAKAAVRIRPPTSPFRERPAQAAGSTPEPWGGPGFDPRTGNHDHYAFHGSDAEFEGILSWVKAKRIPLR
jgi:hypothetical protein